MLLRNKSVNYFFFCCVNNLRNIREFRKWVIGGYGMSFRSACVEKFHSDCFGSRLAVYVYFVRRHFLQCPSCAHPASRSSSI